MTNLQKVIIACHKANPKLLELSFGCKVITKWDSEAIITGRKYDGWWIVGFGGQVMTDTNIKEESITKIIGHDITLEDVLMAIWHNEAERIGNGESFHRILVDSEGWFIQNAPSISSFIRFQKWQLGKPLHEQDENTINFLADLLCKN